MGLTVAQEIITKTQFVLIDTGIRWTPAELLGWLNDGQRDIAINVPNATVKQAVIQLQPGVLQTIPSDGIRLVEITHSMGLDGQTPGPGITVVDRLELEQVNISWASNAPSAYPNHYMWQPRIPTQFYVYPAQPKTSCGWIELFYDQIPADVPTLTGTITINDIYQAALVDYILYRCFLKDAEYASTVRAKGHWEAFLYATGRKSQDDVSQGPDFNQAPRDKENG